MAKVLICVALLCMILLAESGRMGLSKGGRKGPRKPYGGRPINPNRFNGNAWMTKLCANTSVAQAYVDQARKLIADLSSNGSFAQSLQSRQQFTAYLQTTSLDGLIQSNCTTYFSGLQNARTGDWNAMKSQRKLDDIVKSSFMNIIRSLIGGPWGWTSK